MALYTVDASVFLNAFNPQEQGHEESRRFLMWLRRSSIPIVVPTLVLPELAGAVARGQRDRELARRFAEAVARLPRLTLVALDETFARQAAEAAARFQLRGSDAVYAGVALRFGSTLVTLDNEQKTRVAPFVEAREPAEVLASVTE